MPAKIANGAKEAGQGIVEYAMILGLVGLMTISTLALLGPKVGDVFSQISVALGADVSTSTVGDQCQRINGGTYEIRELQDDGSGGTVWAIDSTSATDPGLQLCTF